MSRPKELCFDEGEVSNFEVWGWKLLSVCRGLICLLGVEYGLSKFLVKFVQVYYEVLSS